MSRFLTVVFVCAVLLALPSVAKANPPTRVVFAGGSFVQQPFVATSSFSAVGSGCGSQASFIGGAFVSQPQVVFVNRSFGFGTPFLGGVGFNRGFVGGRGAFGLRGRVAGFRR